MSRSHMRLPKSIKPPRLGPRQQAAFIQGFWDAVDGMRGLHEKEEYRQHHYEQIVAAYQNGYQTGLAWKDKAD